MLAPHVISAQIEMKRLLNTEAGEETEAVDQYAAVLVESATLPRSIICTKAENLLAFAYAIPFLNIETSGRGIVSSKGWDGSRSELMSQGQIEQMVANFREQVMNLLSPYLPVEDDDTTDEEELPILSTGGMTMIAI